MKRLYYYCIVIPTSLVFFGVLATITFFVYEEWSDLHRYSDFGIHLINDDYFQSNIKRRPETTPDSLVDVLGPDVARTYAYLDRDGNGLLSAVEIEPLLHQIRQDDKHQVYNYPPSCPKWTTVLQVECFHLSVQVGELTFQHVAFINAIQYPSSVSREPPENFEDVVNLLKSQFVPVNDQSRLLSFRHLFALIPKEPKYEVGRPYNIIELLPDSDSHFRNQISTRFDPHVEHHERSLSVILNHFYDGYINLYPTTPPEYSMGVVRAKNKDYIDIVFRLHVEFSGYGKSQFILAPSALVGRLVMRYSTRQMVLFELEQESDNIRFHVIRRLAATNLTTVIGVAQLSQLKMNTIDHSVDVSSISWTEAISQREAARLLHSEMYNLKWDAFASLRDLAHEIDKGETLSSKKPIFIASMVGRIDDQTCHGSCVGFREMLAANKLVVKLRYQFNFVLTNIREVEELLAEENLSASVRHLVTIVRDSLQSSVNVLILAPDGKTVISRTIHEKLLNEAENNMKAHNATDMEKMKTFAPDSEDEDPSMFNNHVEEAEAKRRDEAQLTEALVVCYLKFMDNALDIIELQQLAQSANS